MRIRTTASLFFFISLLFFNITVAQFGTEVQAKVDSTNAIPYDFIVSNLQKSVAVFRENVERAQSINYKYGEALAWDKLALAGICQRKKL
jgi:hypothetical protein